MLRLMIASAALSIPAAASASSSIVLTDNGTHAVVKYSDLNLGSRAGQAALKGRIRRAANMVCSDSADRNAFGYSSEREECYHGALNGGLNQMTAAISAPARG